MKKIKAVIKEPYKDCIVTTINDDYKFYSSFVDGLIDITPFPANEEIDIFFNDEFLLKGMEPNLIIPEYKTIYNGPIVFTGSNREQGTQKSLTDEQVKIVVEYCNKNKINNYIEYINAILKLEEN